MANSNGLLTLCNDGFYANRYTSDPFRMIGLVDVFINYYDGKERVTLAFYSSSGTNSGKIKGLWYPIVGIKLIDGTFSEFTSYLNFVLTQTTSEGMAHKGWLVKSLFFYHHPDSPEQLRGFSNGRYYTSLLKIGKQLRAYYEAGAYYHLDVLDPYFLNHSLTTRTIYEGNHHTQKENFERFVEDIFNPF